MALESEHLLWKEGSKIVCDEDGIVRPGLSAVEGCSRMRIYQRVLLMIGAVMADDGR